MINKINIILLLIFLLNSCNLVEWYEKKSIRNLERSEIKNQIFETDSLKMNYYIGGKGPAILFVHGFGGDALVSWKKYLKKYSKTHTVIMADLLWFGKSESKYKACLESQGKALFQLLNHLNIKDVSLLGQSYGGFVVMEMNYQNQNRIKDLIIVNSPGPTFNLSLLDTLVKHQNAKKFNDFFVFEDYTGIDLLMRLSFSKKKNIPKGISKDMYSMYFSKFKNEKNKLLNSLIYDIDRHYNFYKNSNQTKGMIIWSDDDRIFPLSEGKKLANFLDYPIEIVPKTGHVSIIENTKKGFKILDNYFQLNSASKK